ncbi:Response regulators consisting of a CheY-like receiver domain and a winged-helix DNA-binding domain [Roseburia intestinalis M50/1]|nr:Response regulators consisting of a CheY-like receiver domain and a winged-helix DNA-binding domain [Roseburia intestinalis M50/1]
MKHILIVEDDNLLNKTLTYNLELDGYTITSVLNARTAAESLKTNIFDLVLLDINLPDGNGYDLCRLIKPEHPDTVVIFLTANDQESNQIRGYEAGAVDYITKPFSISALQRKIKAMFAMLEHHKPAKDIYEDGSLFLDFSEQFASLNGKPLALSAMEYKMLNLFLKNPKQVLTRQQFLEKLWDVDEKYVDEHTLTTSISRIRSKIEADGDTYIKTVYGMGVSMDRRRKEMNLNNLSAKKICRLVSAGMVFSMLVITGIFGGIMQDIRIFIVGGTLTLCAFFWIWLLVLIFGKRLSHFTSNLCRTLDNMIDGNEELQKSNDSETLFARINHRLIRLYEIMQKNRHKVDMERQELQMLISDISHQVKTPVSNLQMVTDTLLTKPVSEEERMDFLQGIRSQTDKLDFLFQALVKTSRLETGAIRLEKKDSSLFHTLAQAMSSIVYAAEKKEIAVSVDCPENLIISHDSKWTSEALFNLLDNAVKYTPSGGKISVSVVQWEMYVEVKVTDTGKGISESNQAAIFRRFYREEEVHDQQGVGIGLYLAREIVTRQGGYIKVVSELRQGSEFSIMLPVR